MVTITVGWSALISAAARVKLRVIGSASPGYNHVPARAKSQIVGNLVIATRTNQRRLLRLRIAAFPFAAAGVIASRARNNHLRPDG